MSATSASTSQPAQPGRNRVVFFHYRSRKIATLPPTSYEDVGNTARYLFDISEQQHINVQALIEGELAEIDPRLFPFIHDTVTKYWVQHTDDEDFNCTPVAEPGFELFSRSKPTTLNRKSTNASYKPIAFKVDPQLHFSSVFRPLAGQTQSMTRSGFKLTRKGQQIDPEATPRSLQVPEGDPVILENQPRARKPVIYLYPPCSLDLSIELSLTPEWKFSALYPVVPVKRIDCGKLEGGEIVQWNVTANPDGNLIDKRSGSDVAYLFWEAIPLTGSVDTPPNSRPGSPSSIVPIFNPSKANLDPSNSVLLSIDSVPAYLDKALLSLGLHTEARTSFITYWLPDFLKYKHIALRFLNQDSYSAAAPLKIKPTPNVISRIFMLFRCIHDENLDVWKHATQRPADGWRNVVDISLDQMQDDKLFRVLEWGGMEVTVTN